MRSFLAGGRRLAFFTVISVFVHFAGAIWATRFPPTISQNLSPIQLELMTGPSDSRVSESRSFQNSPRPNRTPIAEAGNGSFGAPYPIPPRTVLNHDRIRAEAEVSRTTGLSSPAGPLLFAPITARRAVPREQSPSASCSPVIDSPPLSIEPDPAAGNRDTILNRIRSRLEKVLLYPSTARRRGVSGDMVIGITLSASGTIQTVNLLTPSGYPSLDRAVTKTLQGDGPYPYFPGLIRVPISFRLETGS